jgi:malonyl CoA-acyl carrier protein transacylase/acyl carrier protein/NAD(P)-dependent dehydrogenase (short-subunit alcohol dehydrogenase family)
VRAELTALEEAVWIAALNGPEQVVLSGERGVMERVQPRLEERGLRVKRLAVAQGFHSGLMEPMLEEFAAVARELKYAPLERAVVSNVSGQVKGVGERLESDYWLRQVRETVRFSEGMKRLQEHGCDVYLEVGPRAMLVWLGQECLGAAAAESEWCWSLREGRDEWEQMLESVGKLYVCGADLKWEAVSHGRKVTLPSYPFQRQRYWIDEKPQRETKPQPSAVQKQVRDWLYRVQWQVAPETTETSNITEANWLLFADRQGVAAALAQRLRAQGQRCVLVQVGPNDDADYQLAGTDASEFRRVLSELNVGDLPWRIVYLWSLDAPATTKLTSSSLEEWQRMSCAPLVTLVQSLLAEPQLSEATRLWVVTAGAQATGRSGETLSLAQAPIWGLGKVLALEEAQLWGGLIDLDDARPEQTAAQLQGWIETNGEERVAFRDAVAYVPRVVKLAAANGRGVQIDATGSYLISGGLGALGLTVAEWLVQRGARRLILISRSGLPPSTNGERSEREAVLERLREQGAEVQIVSVDAGDETAMRAVLEKLASSGQRLKGVIHAAGVLQPHGVGELSEAKLLAGLRGKMVGGWVLQQLTRKMELDFFISFSSVSAVWGGIRLGAYAAGNEFLSQLGHYQQQANSKCKALTINWGPWEELEIGSELEQAGYRKLMDELAAARMRGGADVNAVSQQGLLSEVKRMMDQMGVARLSGAQGVAGLEEVLKLDLPQMIVCNVDWSKFLPIYQARRRRPLFDLLQPDRAEAVAPQRSSKLIRSLESAPAQERQKLMETYLQNHVAKALYMNPEDVSTERNLLELGMNSLTIMEVINELRQDIDLTIYPKEFFNQPTLKTLAAYVITELDRKDATNTGDRSTLTAFYPQSLQHIATRTRQAAPGKRNPGVVLLLSSPRSGSTLLRVMLAGHLQIFSPPELHLLSFVGMKERHQTLSLTDLGEGLHRAFMELRQTSIDETKTLIDQLVEADTPIQDVYGMLQQDLGTRLLVDKSPTYAGNIDTLRQAERMFEGAKYIHLVRHPYSVIESFVRVRIHQAAGVPDADPAMLGETVWATTNKNILEFFKEVDADRHHLVRYEELVNDPRAVMLRLCDFLNLPFDDALLKPYDGNRMTDGLHSHSWGIGDVNFLRHDSIDASLGEVWRKIKLPNALGGFAREVAAELSYPLPDEESTPLRAAAASLSAGFEEGRI